MYWYHYTLIGILFVAIIYFSISYSFYQKIFIHFNKKKRKLVDHESDFYKASYDWFVKIPKEDVYIKSYDNLKLHGYFIPSLDKNSDNLAIVIHGYQSQATDMIIIAKLYSDLGFKVLMIDLRGHGQSEGKFTSMGYYEKYDLKKWINFANRNYGATTKILLHGVSMGAAMSMMVSTMNIKNNLKYLVLDSGFTYFSRSLICSLKQKVLSIFIPGVSFWTFILHRFTLKGISPLKAMKKSEVPFLIIQGDKDKPVPLKMAEEIYIQAKTENKRLLVIEGATHAKAFEKDKDLVVNTIIECITEEFKIKKSLLKNM